MVGAHNGNVVNNVQMRELFIREGLTVRGTNDGETCVHAVERHFDRNGGGWSTLSAPPTTTWRATMPLSSPTGTITGVRHQEGQRSGRRPGRGLFLRLVRPAQHPAPDTPGAVHPRRRNRRALARAGRVCTASTTARIDRQAERYDGPIEVAEKGGYPHFMLKEIHEQPAVAGELLHLLNGSRHVDRFLDGCGRPATGRSIWSAADQLPRLPARCVLLQSIGRGGRRAGAGAAVHRAVRPAASARRIRPCLSARAARPRTCSTRSR